ncbi:hypothetical protein EYF80_024345 [Liparis tanakae]|uniref:Uncharacterized protein n=1 Tax=Liparis tanakae TaxID=230148 RepID=A0A4Z2HJH2_9TELE|nr:hypothetical protein EYF80_024345 [Liparis tanakae]
MPIEDAPWRDPAMDLSPGEARGEEPPMREEEMGNLGESPKIFRTVLDVSAIEGDFFFAPLRDAYRQNDMPRLNGSLRLPGVLPAARIDQL